MMCACSRWISTASSPFEFHGTATYGPELTASGQRRRSLSRKTTENVASDIERSGPHWIINRSLRSFREETVRMPDDREPDFCVRDEFLVHTAQALQTPATNWEIANITISRISVRAVVADRWFESSPVGPKGGRAASKRLSGLFMLDHAEDLH